MRGRACVHLSRVSEKLFLGFSVLFLGFSVMNGGQHRFRSGGIYNIVDTYSQVKYEGIANLKVRRRGVHLQGIAVPNWDGSRKT
jgi:hypothetical protein